jgi:hypothetical protein
MEKKKTTGYNSSYPKVAVTWYIEHLCFLLTSSFIDSLVLLNRHLRVAANRWQQAKHFPKRAYQKIKTTFFNNYC